ncbi:MAG: hypothetical protein Kow00127_04720 [Bacteroidales bacterium]
MKPNSFPRKERLRRKNIIDHLFRQGNRISQYPLTLIWCEADLPEEVPVQVMFAVSKKKVRKAWKRNRIRRQMREAWRLNRHQLAEKVESSDGQIAVSVIYGDSELPDYQKLEAKIILALQRLQEEYEKTHRQFDDRAD